MTQVVELPNGGTVEFPDGMSTDEMSAAISSAFPEFSASSPGPRSSAVSEDEAMSMREDLPTARSRSVMDNLPADAGRGGSLIEERGAPVSPEYFAEIKRRYELATPEARAAMAKAGGPTGAAVRAIDKTYAEQDQQTEGLASAPHMGGRVEDRTKVRLRQDYGPDAAKAEAMEDVRTGTAPGPAALAESTLDFEAKNATGAQRLWQDVESGVVGSTGAMLSHLGRKSGDKDIADVGESMSRWSEGKMPANPTFVDKLVNGIGSSASFLIPGLGVTKGAEALAIISRTAAKWTGAGTMAALEAAAEADGVYRQLIASGASEERAAREADGAFWANMALLGVTDKVAFFSDLKAAKTALGRFGQGAAPAVPSEGVQEMGQQVIGNVATDRPVSEGVGEAGLIGALVGGISGGVKNVLAPSAPRPVDVLQAPTTDVAVATMQAAVDADVSVDPELNTAIAAIGDLARASQPAGPSVTELNAQRIAAEEAAGRGSDLSIATQQEELARQNVTEKTIATTLSNEEMGFGINQPAADTANLPDLSQPVTGSRAMMEQVRSVFANNEQETPRGKTLIKLASDRYGAEAIEQQRQRAQASFSLTQDEQRAADRAATAPIRITTNERGTHDVTVENTEQAAAVTQALTAAGVPMTKTPGDSIRISRNADKAQADQIIARVNTQFSKSRFTPTESPTTTFPDLDGTQTPQTQQTQVPPVQAAAQPGTTVQSYLRTSLGLPESATVEEVEPDSTQLNALGKPLVTRLEAKAARIIGGLFGTKVRFYRSSVKAADGFYRGGDTVWIDVEVPIHPLSVFGHEWTHSLEESDSDSHEALKAAVTAMMTPERALTFSLYYDKDNNYGWRDASGKLKADANMTQIVSEASADLGGNLAHDSTFYQEVFDEVARQHPHEKARTIIQKIATSLINAINKLLASVGKSGYKQAFETADRLGLTREELLKARDIIRQAAVKAIAKENEARAKGKPFVTDAQNMGVPAGTGETQETPPRKPGSDAGHKRASDGRYVGAPDWVGGSPEMLKIIRKKLRQLADEGSSGRYWYEKSSKAVLDMFNGNRVDAEKFIGLLAIYSQGTSVPANTAAAIKAWGQWKAGVKIDAGRFPESMGKKAAAWLNRGEDWGGTKVNNFYQDLMEEIDPSKVDHGHSTMDMWMALAFDYGDKVLDQGPKYLFAQREIAKLAAELGWKPHQVQAAIWTAIKSRVESSENLRNEQEIAAGIRVRDPKEQAKGKDSWVTAKGREYEHLRLAHRLGMAHVFSAMDVPKESRVEFEARFAGKKMAPSDVISELGEDFSDALKKRYAQMSLEVIPSTSVSSIRGIHTAPMVQVAEYQEAMKAAFTGPDGRDIIDVEIGNLLSNEVTGYSGWEGKTNIGLQRLLTVQTDSHGGTDKQTVVGKTRDMLNLSAAVHGIVWQQDGVAWHFPLYTGAKNGLNGVEFKMGRMLTEQESDALYKVLQRELGHNESMPIPTADGAGFRVLNFPGEKFALQQEMKSASKDLVGQSEADIKKLLQKSQLEKNEDFHKAVVRAVSVQPWVNEVIDKPRFESDGELISNDWSQGNDQEYREQILQTLDGFGPRSWGGRSDIFKWIDDVLRPKADAVNKQFAAKYGWDGQRTLFSQPRASDEGRDGRSGERAQGQGRPSYGEGIEGSVSVTGVHYSTESREQLDGAFYGRGLKGAERPRVMVAKDARLRQRVYFYINTGNGTPAEAGVGAVAHTVDLRNLYDMDADERGLMPEGLMNDNDRMNGFESNVIDAGYDGYLTRNFGNRGAAVLIGKHSVSVAQEANPDVGAAGKVSLTGWKDQQQKVMENRALPGGQMTGADWKRLMPKLMPEIDVAHLDDAKSYYKDQLVQQSGISYSKTRAVNTESAEFKLWFGDWQNPKAFSSKYPADKTPVSSAVNADNSPMRLYHATNNDFTAFETGRESITSTTLGDFETRRHAIFTTPDVAFAEEYLKKSAGQNVMPIYMDIKNPMDLRNNKAWDYVDELYDNGFPGTRWPNMSDTQMWEMFDDETGEQFVAAAKKAGYDGAIIYEVNADDKMVEVWVAFSPTQIKSAISNTGEFSSDNPDIRYSTPRFVSTLAQQIAAMPDKVSGTSATNVKAWLLSNAEKLKIKKDELHWSGVLDWLDAQGKAKVARDAVSEYLRQGGVRVTETMLDQNDVVTDVDIVDGDTVKGYDLQQDEDGLWSVYTEGDRPDDDYRPTALYTADTREDVADWINQATEGNATPKFAGYTLPGGENYRELLLTLPVGKARVSDDQARQLGADKGWETDDIKFKSSHWQGTPNVLAHMRVDTVRGANGEKLLRVIEIQSDFGAAIRKSIAPTPSAPFVTDTKSWTALVIKRAVMLAVTEGYDGIVFATGQQNADIYDLSKQLDTVLWDGNEKTGTLIARKDGANVLVEKDIDSAKLADFIGKDVAEKLLTAKKNQYGMREVSGLAMDVGGEGMLKFYGHSDPNKPVGVDKHGNPVFAIVPVVAKSVLKQIGASDVKLGALDIQQGETFAEERGLETKPVFGPQPGFLIPDTLRTKITTDGVPLFSAPRDRTNIDTALRRMSKMVDAFEEKQIDENYSQILGPTPVVLRALGAPDLQLEIDGAVLQKVLRGKHKLDITPKMLKSLPEGVYDPVMAFIKPDGDILLITDSVAATGNQIAAAINFRQQAGRLKVNRIATAFEYNHMIERLSKLAKSLRYVRNEEGLATATTPDQPFLSDVVQQARDLGADIITENDLVKLYTSPRYSAPRLIGDSGRQYTPAQEAMHQNVGRITDDKTPLERIKEYLSKRWQQGIFDQFHPFRGIDKSAYALMRLSKGAAGAFEAFLKHGKLNLVDGVYDAEAGAGVLQDVFVPLGREVSDFLYWVAGNRAERLAAEGKERLFSVDDINAAKALADGVTEFDYTLTNGQVTRDRTLIYKDALIKFNEYNKNVMDMAEESGLIDGTARKMWEHEFYVPFYRVMEDDNLRAMGIKKGLVRQEAFKRLKGGDKPLGDLLENTLLNWHHLIDASAKNRAAKAAVEAAERMGLARAALPGETKTVWFIGNGQKVEYKIDDLSILEAINGLQYVGLRGPLWSILTAPKHWLTMGVTASPFFKIRNLIRDSMQAVATSDLNYNVFGNVARGYQLTNRERQEYISALASGGLIRFGTMYESNEAARTRQLIKQGSKDVHLLDSEGALRKFWDKTGEPALMWYNELGNRGEEINRMALFQQMVDAGATRAEAALAARDLMDFSLQGGFETVRILAQVVPFFNARLQGMYKLGRASNEHREHMAVVTFTAAVAGLALMAIAASDDDRWKRWKRLDEHVKAGYWVFFIGSMEFRIPRPFELGAVAHAAERTVEALFDKERDAGKRLGQAMLDSVKNQLAMVPMPQAVKPIVDIYANKDSFTGRDIESMSMERLDPQQRFNANTSMLARVASNATGGTLSPVQYDHLVRGYFGWLGAMSVAAADETMRLVNTEPKRPQKDYWNVVTGGLVKDDPVGGRYISVVYDQAKELEQAYATFNKLRKEGKTEEAREYREDNADKLKAYRSVESVKKQLSKLNERIRVIERSDKHPAEKRILIRELRERESDIAQRLSQ